MNRNDRKRTARDARGYAGGTLSEEGVRRYLGGVPRRLSVHKVIDSTNDEAKRLIAGARAAGDIPFGAVIVAEEQTAGRGRRGRAFASPAADSVYMSFVLKPAGEIENTLLVTIMAAVAVCEAIEAVTEAAPSIKWVNDIYVEGKKVCGILTEAVSRAGSGAIDGLALGVGVNVNAPAGRFPEELRGTVGSIDMNPGDRCLFAAELIRRVVRGYETLTRGESPIRAYRERSFVIGREVAVIRSDGAEVPALAEGVADDGSLLVRYADGRTESLRSGEVSLRIR
jgi:BirA family biotin operon repressor/biotin-[acetyl-CoA-carboxylase] ligase